MPHVGKKTIRRRSELNRGIQTLRTSRTQERPCTVITGHRLSRKGTIGVHASSNANNRKKSAEEELLSGASSKNNFATKAMRTPTGGVAEQEARR